MLTRISVLPMAVGWIMAGASAFAGLAPIPSVDEDAAQGRIAGVVQDQSGAIVPGARVTITNLASGLTRFTVTNQQGRHAFDAVSAGRYRASAVSPGFEPSLRDDITVVGGREAAGWIRTESRREQHCRRGDGSGGINWHSGHRSRAG